MNNHSKKSEIMSICYVAAEKEPELFLENETGAEFEVRHIEDPQVGKEYIIFSATDQEEKEQVFAAHNIRLSAGAILIEQITVSEIQHLELTVKRNDKQTITIHDYFEYYHPKTPRDVQLYQAACIVAERFASESAADLYDTAILKDDIHGTTAKIYTKLHSYILRCGVNFSGMTTEIRLQLPLEIRKKNADAVRSYLEEVNHTMSENAEFHLNEHGEVFLDSQLSFCFNAVTVKQLDKELQHLLILADALFDNIREIGE